MRTQLIQVHGTRWAASERAERAGGCPYNAALCHLWKVTEIRGGKSCTHLQKRPTGWFGKLWEGQPHLDSREKPGANPSKSSWNSFLDIWRRWLEKVSMNWQRVNHALPTWMCFYGKMTVFVDDGRDVDVKTLASLKKFNRLQQGFRQWLSKCPCI